jgi:hypothetical protein
MRPTDSWLRPIAVACRVRSNLKGAVKDETKKRADPPATRGIQTVDGSAASLRCRQTISPYAENTEPIHAGRFK